MTQHDVRSNRPLRVLHVLEATGGGTMRYMENIAEATEGAGIVFGFAYGFSRADSHLSSFLKHIIQLGWSAFPIDMRRSIRLGQDLAALWELRRVIHTFRPDVLHCHSSKAGALGRAAAIGLSQRPRRLYSPHAIAAPLSELYLTIERVFARFTDHFVAVSESEREQIIDFDLAKPENISVVYPSVDCRSFQPASRERARTQLELGPSPTVITIGRLTAQKHPSLFLAVIREVCAHRPDVRAIWLGAGGGPETLAFIEAVAASGLAHVVSVIPWTDDIRCYLAASDLLLSTSRFESFGYVTAEALAMEIPVVASNVTGTRDIMQGDLQRWLYPLGDHKAAAELLLQLLNDPAKAAKVAKDGRALVQTRFDRTTMRDALLNAYATTLGPDSKALRTHPAPAGA